MKIILDCFTGPAANLPKNARTLENVLLALRANGRVSIWDMSESAWLRDCISILKRSGKIKEAGDEPYPWHRYVVSEDSSQ